MAFLRIFFHRPCPWPDFRGFYYMMVLRHDSPQRTLGKRFQDA